MRNQIKVLRIRGFAQDPRCRKSETWSKNRLELSTNRCWWLRIFRFRRLDMECEGRLREDFWFQKLLLCQTYFTRFLSFDKCRWAGLDPFTMIGSSHDEKPVDKLFSGRVLGGFGKSRLTYFACVPGMCDNILVDVGTWPAPTCADCPDKAIPSLDTWNLFRVHGHHVIELPKRWADLFSTKYLADSLLPTWQPCWVGLWQTSAQVLWSQSWNFVIESTYS